MGRCMVCEGRGGEHGARGCATAQRLTHPRLLTRPYSRHVDKDIANGRLRRRPLEAMAVPGDGR
eukprot:282822-Chlamydomonas_euryale.AAC.5